MADKISKEIEAKEALDAHMRQHCEEQNCIQQCCQNYLSQIADFSKKQVESARQPFINSNLPNHPGNHFHHFHPQQQQQHGHFHGHFGHFGHFHHGNHHNHYGN